MLLIFLSDMLTFAMGVDQENVWRSVFTNLQYKVPLVAQFLVFLVHRSKAKLLVLSGFCVHDLLDSIL